MRTLVSSFVVGLLFFAASPGVLGTVAPAGSSPLLAAAIHALLFGLLVSAALPLLFRIQLGREGFQSVVKVPNPGAAEDAAAAAAARALKKAKEVLETSDSTSS